MDNIIVASQWCIGFCCIAKRNSCMCTCIPSFFLNFFSACPFEVCAPKESFSIYLSPQSLCHSSPATSSLSLPNSGSLPFLRPLPLQHELIYLGGRSVVPHRGKEGLRIRPLGSTLAPLLSVRPWAAQLPKLN